MNKPTWLDNKTATIFGVIFFPQYVIFAFRLNVLMLKDTPLSGGRLFWRQVGWGIITSIPFVGLIYGLMNLNNIIDTRNQLWEVMQKNK